MKELEKKAINVYRYYSSPIETGGL